MQVTGNITQCMSEGGYNSGNGYIYTFRMTIQTDQGDVTGEIGSKSQNYPLGQGQQITVDVEDGQYGKKFTKVNAQYSGGGQGGGSQRPQTQQGGGGGSKKNDAVQLYIIRQSSARSAVEFLKGVNADEGNILSLASRIEKYVMTGQVPPLTADNRVADDDIPF